MAFVTDPWFYALAIPAVLITGISKGGFASGAGNLLVPLMALTVPAPVAAGIALPVLCAMDVSGLRAWWGKWDKREMRVLIPGALVGILVGGLVFTLMSDRAIKAMVGITTLAFLARTLWLARHREPPAPAPHNPVKGGLCAAASGFTSTIAHAGSPPLAIYLYPRRLDRQVMAATTVVFFGIVNYVKLVPYFFLGNLSIGNLTTSLVLLPLAPAGVYLGIWMQRHVSDALFYRILYALLLVTGVKLTWDGVFAG
ncbi:sulfite exporter TauE/SafE family protein [Roseomonas rosulenta]|uniref:sulfite exporter TauE/SafE family protein n=1 Tax=Roseomonas rosulenta TaxID=2748667 RepID=UPI0018DFE777|nr:sulfite exporter TauE/SafE family protein [Roseomonas rosulenta]